MSIKLLPPALSVLALGVLAALALPAQAQARVSLSEDAHITNSLVSAAVGAAIADQCGAIEPRNVTVFFKTMALKRYAQDLGYSTKEINAFVRDREERRRVRELARDYLTKNGVKIDDTASFCALGRAEIAKKSLTGQLLRQNGR